MKFENVVAIFKAMKLDFEIKTIVSTPVVCRALKSGNKIFLEMNIEGEIDVREVSAYSHVYVYQKTTNTCMETQSFLPHKWDTYKYQYWMVHKPGTATRFQHPTREAAVKEAARLSKENGCTYYVGEFA